MQWHKRILSNFYLGLEDWIAYTYKGVCWEMDWLFPIWKTVMIGRKKKILIGILLLPWVDFLRGESFFKLILPSTVATWEPGIHGSGWRSPGRLRHDPRDQIPRQVETCQPPGTPGLADPWAGVTKFWRPDPRQVKASRPPGTPELGVGHPQDLQCDQCWVGLRGCNLKSLLICPLWMGINIMM